MHIPNDKNKTTFWQINIKNNIKNKLTKCEILENNEYCN